MAEFLRFFLVALSGLAIDLSVSWLLAVKAGLPLWLAAIGGFCVAASINYVMHEYWTFRGREAQLSVRRAAQYMGLLGVTLAVRLAAIFEIQQLVGNRIPPILILLFATGCSFLANYGVGKLVLFARETS